MAQANKNTKKGNNKKNNGRSKASSQNKGNGRGKKSQKTIDAFRKQNVIALFLLMIGMFFLLSITTNALGAVGSMIRAVLLGQFGSIAVFAALIMIIIGVGRLVYSTRFDLSIISPIMVLLVFSGSTIFYGAFNLHLLTNEKISFELLRTVFIQSVVKKNIGLLPYLTSAFLSRSIGKTGMYLSSCSIFLFVIIYYFKVSFSKIGDVSIALASGSKEAVKELKKKTIDYISVNEDNEQRSRAKLDETMIEDKFGFLERYKKEVAEFTEFDGSDKEELLSSFVQAENKKLENSAEEELLFAEERSDLSSEASTVDEIEVEDSLSEMTQSEMAKDKILQPEECRYEISEVYPEAENADVGATKRYVGLSRSLAQATESEVSKEEIVDNRSLHQKDRIEKENLEKYASNDKPVIIAKNNKSYVLPVTSLLKSYNLKPREISQQLKEIHKLESTLKIYGIEAKVVNISVGPTITRYELQLKIGVKVSKILNLSDDLALAMAAVAPIRIEAPIPGTSLIGIELPNAETDIVSFREMLETKEFIKSNGKIPVALGQDVSGKPIIADITKMPHVLVAGATGSGKSVCINTLICSILFRSKPEEVKMIMIDPKMVELSVYNDIPHLLVPVVTDMKKAPYALSWAVTEMNKRYKLFAENRVRDLEGYNSIAGVEKLPRIVIIVDELADLMMVSPHEVEDSIIRLAQKARACGMHLVIATQRPSVDVITGLIKANIPTRIAFAVSSQIDSRTILDQVGAEKLIGKGDMLFSHPSIAKPQRIQGPFISDDEVNNVVDHILDQGHRAEEKEDIIEESIKKAEADQKEEEQDPLMEEIKGFVMENKQISTSLIQRRFRIGYNRASRIIDQLEEMGIVSESDGAKPRKVLISSEDLEGAE
ncbi:MAG: DNA translocase FtsK [Peptostreptococcaceae bacterium]|nr:DNA translocase FtsK [Peptostreptococcaceae bacterium]